MRAREIAHTQRDNNRLVRPFEWGVEFVRDHANGDDPRAIFSAHTEQVMARSEDFYALPEINDWELKDNVLTWTSAVHTPSAENNIARARLFTPRRERRNKPRSGMRNPIVTWRPVGSSTGWELPLCG